MKFMIKELGWARWREEIRPRAGRRAGCAARCRRSRSIRRPTRVEARLGRGPRRRRSDVIARASSPAPPNGPGITPTVVPVLISRRRGLRAVARDERPPAEAVRLRDGRRPRCRSAISRASRCACVGELAQRLRRRHRPRHDRSGPRVPVGERQRRARAVSPPGRRGPRAGRGGHDRRRHELPGRRVVPARGDAVARSRPAARGSPARAARSDRGGRRRAHQDQRLPERLRPAPHRDDRLPGQRAPRRRHAPCRSTS